MERLGRKFQSISEMRSMSKITKYPPRELRLPHQVASYLDRTADLDREMALVANLCLSAQDRGLFDESFVVEIGHTVDTYLARRAVAEHFFLGRSLRRARIGPPLLKAELARLRAIQDAGCVE